MYRYLLVFCVSALLLVACDTQETKDFSGMGAIRITATVDEPVSVDSISLTLASADGRYTKTWGNIEDFPDRANYYTGTYHAMAFVGTPGSEGIDCPCYSDETDFEVLPDATAEVSLHCTLAQAVFDVSTAIESDGLYSIEAVTLHSQGHAYIEAADDGSQIYLTPDITGVQVTVADKAGRSVRLAPDFSISTSRGRHYPVLVSANNTLLTVQSENVSTDFPLGSDLFDSPAPQITYSGFTEGETVSLTEGLPSEKPLIMKVESSRRIESLILTVDGVPLSEIPVEGNILDSDILSKYDNLVVNRISDCSYTVDYTKFLEQLTVKSQSNIDLRLVARDVLGRVSDVGLLKVYITGVDLSLISVSNAVIGINIASVAIAANVPELEYEDFSVSLDESWNQESNTLQIVSAWMDADTRTMHLSFIVPEGNTDVPVLVTYRNTTSVPAVISRVVPVFTVDADAFATTARLQVHAESESMVAAITKWARVYTDGREITVLSRDPETGVFWIAGLSPSKSYTVDTRVISDTKGVSTSMRTETDADVPDGGFEDADISIDYKHLASGGVFSSSTFPIYNQQNFMDINVYWPRRYWTSVNAKTFCKAPDNRNTWYMQPSAVIDYDYYAQGSKSIRLTSVGWSVTGGEITPYLQEASNYLPYSNVIPMLDHRAAGRAFLGSYGFDPVTLKETYNEGVPFKSRPSSLNGYFRYVPDSRSSDDCGMLRIEIINDSDPGHPVTIASAETRFASSPYFKAFNLPLQYYVYNMSATKLRIMIMSSDRAGDIAVEDRDVPVTPMPSEAKFSGSTLWIDNLTFTY